MGVEQLKIPTIDFTGTPTQENIHKAVKFIIGHRNLNNSVYVHCKAGRTRSAVVVACYLIHVNNIFIFFYTTLVSVLLNNFLFYCFHNFQRGNITNASVYFLT